MSTIKDVARRAGVSIATVSSEIEDFLPEDYPVVLIDRRLKHSPLDIVSVSDAAAITAGMSRLIDSGRHFTAPRLLLYFPQQL